MFALFGWLFLSLVNLVLYLSCDPPGKPKDEMEEKEFPRPGWLPKSTVNWGIAGQTGGGKSGLNNGLRGLNRSHPLASEEGASETTMKPTAYPFPQLEQCKIWDLPGGGTADHPAATYIRDKGLRYFHGVMVVVKDGRVTEFDAMLVKDLEKFKVPFYVVQNRFQQVCDSEEVDVKNAELVQQLVTKVKKQVAIGFEKFAVEIKPDRIFMVRSWDATAYEVRSQEQSAAAFSKKTAKGVSPIWLERSHP